MAERSAFTTLYFKGSPEEKDANGVVTKPAVAAGPYDMFPIDATEALRRDPDNWSRKPFDAPKRGVEGGDPGQEAGQSAHGNDYEEIRANEQMLRMREDGQAAEPAGSNKGVRPGSYSPDVAPRPAPEMLVDPAAEASKDKPSTKKPGSPIKDGPKAGDPLPAA